MNLTIGINMKYKSLREIEADIQTSFLDMANNNSDRPLFLNDFSLSIIFLLEQIALDRYEIQRLKLELESVRRADTSDDWW